MNYNYYQFNSIIIVIILYYIILPLLIMNPRPPQPPTDGYLISLYEQLQYIIVMITKIMSIQLQR